jgi:predicted dehydrogenase
MLRGAIIGLGNVGREVHVPAWARRGDVTIVAANDSDPARRPLAAASLPAARWYDSAQDLLARERLDFVDICTPPSSHGPLVCQALERGLHVFCEKPLVISRDELDRVTTLADKTRRVVHTVHNWHHAPIIKRASALVREGTVGRLTRVAWRTLRTQPAAAAGIGNGNNWRLDPALAGGGILTDHGWHAFYLLAGWIGDTPTAVTARLERRGSQTLAVEDTATVSVSFPDAAAEIFLTWAADRRENVADLVASAGRIELRGETLTLERNGRVERWSCPPSLANGSVHPDWFDPEVAQFLDAVTRTPPQSNLGEAWLCGALEGAARESSRRGGQPVAVPALPLSMA